VPAVQKVREAANRTKCVNNVKQITLAVHTYHDQNRNSLPALCVNRAAVFNTGNYSPQKYGNYTSNILFTLCPFIEQQGLYDVVVNQGTWQTGANWTSLGVTWINTPVWGTGSNQLSLGNGALVRAQSINTFICPTDTGVQGGYWSFGQVNQWAASSYGANMQMFGQTQYATNVYLPNFNLGNIPDGTSNTVAFGEKFSNCNGSGAYWAADGIDWESWVNNPVIAYAVNYNWGNTVVYNVAAGGNPGDWDYPPQLIQTPQQCNPSGSHAIHFGNMVTSMMDGSVRTVGSYMSATTWHDALMPNDYNTLGSDW